MLNEICGFLRNYFDRERYNGEFTIENGKILTELPLLDGQYIRIVGSLLNDGVYVYGDTIEGLKDETFTGAIWSLAIPKELVLLSKDIKEWVKQNSGVDSAAMSPFQSESFGGYSYSKGANNSENGASYASGDWKSVFASRLGQWRKI